MVEFYGRLSKTSLPDINKRKKKNEAIVFGSALLVFIIITIGIGIFAPADFKEFLFWTVLYAAVYIIILILPSRTAMIPKKITITQDGVTQEIVGFSSKPICKSMQKVKKVIDVGACYYIYFKFGDISNACVCQKDLIAKGTIEEFEKLFEGKIVRDKSLNG